MGLAMDLEFDKYCIVDGSPDTVLPSPRQFKVERSKKARGKHKGGNDLLSPNKGFADISFRRYRSASHKRIPSQKNLLEGNEVIERGSLYQSSHEVTEMKNMSDVQHRRKIEFPQSSATALSLEIVDSLCSSDEDSWLLEQNRSSVISLNSELSTSLTQPQSALEFLDLSFHTASEKDLSSENLLQMSFGPESRGNELFEYVEKQSSEDHKCRCDAAASPPRDGNGLRKRDAGSVLRKLPSSQHHHSPSLSESSCSTPSTTKSRFSPIRKMFDPFPKFKSQRSPLSTEYSQLVPTEKFSISRNKELRKSLIHDFSNTTQDTQCDSQLIKKENCKPLMPCSPAHLHGLLTLVYKYGMPFFEFSVKNLEDKFVAKTWKEGNALNWVYTFHSCQNKRKSSATGWGLKETNKEYSMVGQMQVSCFLCAELKDAKSFEKSVVTEFVLYDIAQARKSITAQTNQLGSLPEVTLPPKGSNEILTMETSKLDQNSNQSKTKVQPKIGSNIGHHPWKPQDLHANLEIAAIVIQVPIEKRESLKGKKGDQQIDQAIFDLHNPTGIQRTNCLSSAKVNVVTSSGNHSLPTIESPGPSRLMDRWKSGGNCDCGGWDMGCPLIVFDNSNIQCAEDHTFMNDQQPWKLYVRGGKDRTPALRMTVTEDGNYEVDFHAQLTTLQAFSICVAIWHSTEASIAVGQATDEQLLPYDSLVFIDEDVKHLIESVAEEEKRKEKKKIEAPSYIALNPPFSPISRV